MSKQILVASADDVIEQIVAQCHPYRARAGDHSGARASAERTLERLLARGLPCAESASGGLLLDPYAASNWIKARVGEPADEAWSDWLDTGRRNAGSLPPQPHRYRLTLHREWHAFKSAPGRPLIFRLPLPRRQSARILSVRLLEPAAALIDRRDSEGRVELRVAAAAGCPVSAELIVEFASGESRDSGTAAAALIDPRAAEDELWLRPLEGLIKPSAKVARVTQQLVEGTNDARAYVHAVWFWLMKNLRCGDVLRSELDTDDPLGGLFERPMADCVLASSMLVAMCRAAGIPARVVTGFLLHPAVVAPHSWAEVRLAAGNWAPFDFASWAYCAGDPLDPVWGNFFRGRIDARMIAEVDPHEFTGWGSAPVPQRWYRLERLRGDQMEHTLRCLDTGALVRRDLLKVEIIGRVNSAV